MHKISPLQIRRGIKEYLLISFGLMMYCFAWVGIIMPANITGGGASGVAMLVYYATGGAEGGIPLGYTFFAFNAILIIIASIIIGAKFGAKTIYAIVFISVMLDVMQNIVPPDLMGLGSDKLLSAILGGAVAGAGVGICFMQGGSTGGTDIVVMIVSKYRSISYGKLIILCDFIIIGSSIFVMKNITAIIYGYVFVAAFGYMVDLVMAGNRQSSQVLIISRKYNEVAAHIGNEMRRGVTLLDGEGWYTKEKMKVVMVVCRKNETGMLFRLVKDCDPDAFLTVGSVMGVYGLGFEKLKNK